MQLILAYVASPMPLFGKAYYRIHSQAFDNVPLFQQHWVQPEKGAVKREVLRKLASISRNNGGRVPTYHKFVIQHKGIEGAPISSGHALDILGYGLNGPHRVDVTHEVTVRCKGDRIDWSIDSDYEWHDKFDMNTWGEMVENTKDSKSFVGKWMARILEGAIGNTAENILGLEYYFTILYSRRDEGNAKVSDLPK